MSFVILFWWLMFDHFVFLQFCYFDIVVFRFSVVLLSCCFIFFICCLFVLSISWFVDLMIDCIVSWLFLYCSFFRCLLSNLSFCYFLVCLFVVLFLTERQKLITKKQRDTDFHRARQINNIDSKITGMFYDIAWY